MSGQERQHEPITNDTHHLQSDEGQADQEPTCPNPPTDLSEAARDEAMSACVEVMIRFERHAARNRELAASAHVTEQDRAGYLVLAERAERVVATTREWWRWFEQHPTFE